MWPLQMISLLLRRDRAFIILPYIQIGGYFKTWKLEREKLLKQESTFLNPSYTHLNSMVFTSLYFHLLWLENRNFISTGQYFGISMLESQNYFSHYGLTRNKKEDGSYERVKAHHSWNSDHLLGRILLFELTRHSDHHFMGQNHTKS